MPPVGHSRETSSGFIWLPTEIVRWRRFAPLVVGRVIGRLTGVPDFDISTASYSIARVIPEWRRSTSTLHRASEETP